MDTWVFFYGSLPRPRRGKYTHTNWYPPFFGGCSAGNRDELSHVSYSWVALDVISTALPPSVTPGCCEPNPLLSSVAGARGWGGAGSARRNPAVRVPGQGSSSSLSRAMKHKRLLGRRERPRGTHHPETVCTVFFIRG